MTAPRTPHELLAEIEDFRKSSEESVKKNWLVVIGLDWLRVGANSVGSSGDSDVRLPAKLPSVFARIHHSPDKNEIEFVAPNDALGDVTVDATPVKQGERYVLETDEGGKATVVKVESVSFFLIQRPNGVGVRMKDTESPAVKAFLGLRWWPHAPSARVVGKWKPLAEPRKMSAPDVLGNVQELSVDGFVEFDWEGQKLALYPSSKENASLFFVFRDSTSGKESYGAARYLTTAQPDENGDVVLDFNKARNPPCAYIAYATCPLPPKENVLKVGIRAGELKPDESH